MSNGTQGRGTKVARLIDEYDLSGMGARLEAAWTGASGERTSLRDLADEHYGAPILEPLGTYRPTTSDARARRPTTELA